MKFFSTNKYFPLVLASFVAASFTACGGGDLKCESSEVKKAFYEHHNIKGFKEAGAEFGDLKTLSKDENFKSAINCQCSIKMGGESSTMKFSAERLQDGGISIVIDDVGL